MNEFICTHPILYTFSILILSFFPWALLFGLAQMASDKQTDAEKRLMRHVRETDEHGDGL